jgi:hypothetical protein
MLWQSRPQSPQILLHQGVNPFIAGQHIEIKPGDPADFRLINFA